jgi:hypothetical protein
MAENLMPLFLTRPLLRDRARCRQGLSCRTRRSVVFLCPFVAACHAAPMDKEDGQACDKRGTQEACAPHVTAAGTVRLLGHPEMKICPETNTFSSVMNRCSNTPCTRNRLRPELVALFLLPAPVNDSRFVMWRSRRHSRSSRKGVSLPPSDCTNCTNETMSRGLNRSQSFRDDEFCSHKQIVEAAQTRHAVHVCHLWPHALHAHFVTALEPTNVRSMVICPGFPHLGQCVGQDGFSGIAGKTS